MQLHCFFFFFNDPATTEISPLPLHDALPISRVRPPPCSCSCAATGQAAASTAAKGSHLVQSLALCLPFTFCVCSPVTLDRKSTRLNSSHLVISYAVFCLKKKNSPTVLSSSTC